VTIVLLPNGTTVVELNTGAIVPAKITVCVNEGEAMVPVNRSVCWRVPVYVVKPSLESVPERFKSPATLMVFDPFV
jgi:hypothetical protein